MYSGRGKEEPQMAIKDVWVIIEVLRASGISDSKICYILSEISKMSK